MALPSTGSLSIKDLQDEISIQAGNQNDFEQMANIFDISNFNPSAPEDITLADDFYGETVNLTATSLTVNPDILTWTSAGGNNTTNLSINGNALMIGKPGWLSTENTYLTTAEGGSMVFTAGENSLLGSSNRSATISFIGLNSSTLESLIVSQSGNPVEITLTPSTSQTFTQTAGTYNQDLEVTNPLVVVGELTGSGFTLGTPSVTNLGTTSRYRFVLTRTENTGTARTAELNFQISGSGFVQYRSITHTQTAFAAQISVSPTSYDFAQGGETKEFTVAANTDWETLTSGDSGFQTSVTSASSGFSTSTKNGSNNGSVWVKASNNSTLGNEDRTATLIVRERPWGGGGEFDNTTLTQDGNPYPDYSYSDALISGFAVAMDGLVSPPTSGDTTNTPTVSVTYSTGFSNGYFPSPVSSNTTRYAYVSVTVPSGYSGAGGTVTGTESATQQAPVETITLSTSNTAISGQGGTASVAVTTSTYFNTSWTAEISTSNPSQPPTWTSLGAYTSGQGSSTLYISVGGNYSGQSGYNGSSRSFTVRVYKTSNAAINDTQSFTQTTGTPPVQVPQFSVNPTSGTWTYSQSTSNTKSFTATYTGGGSPTTLSFYLTGTYFGMSSNSAAMTMSVTGGPYVATGNTTTGPPYSVNVFPLNSNSGISDLTENMSVSMGNQGGNTNVTVGLTHEGNQTWSISPTSVTVDYTTGNSNVTLTTNLAWEATLTNGTNGLFSLSGGDSQTGSGNKTFLITRGTNNRGSNITATLLLESTTSGTSQSDTITLTQNPEPSTLKARLNSSSNLSTSITDITPNTYGQSYAVWVQHDGPTSGTVTVSISNENVSHVGVSASSTSGGSNSVSLTNVGSTAQRVYLNYNSNSLNQCRTATITIQSNIATNSIIFNSSYGACTGQPCILKGTKVKLSDGTLTKVENILVGDSLSSKLFAGMPIKRESEVLDWTSEEMNLSEDTVDVTNIQPYHLDNILDFNTGLIKTSYDHLHLVKKQNLYQVVTAENVSVGDFFIREDGSEVEIISIVNKSGNYTVYKLDVEENDLFIANGLLTHNRKEQL